jgi:hypothetical protein
MLSLYADDLVIFIMPTEQDLLLLRSILDIFVGASGLHTNLAKCMIMPIPCSNDQINLGKEIFPCQIGQFPCRYLGIPLSIYQLKKADLQPLVDVTADRLPTWNSRVMSRAGRTTLAKVTLSTIPIHVTIAVKAAPWIIKAFDKIRRAFIWFGTDMSCGRKCMLAWSRVTRPTELSDLGVVNLTTLGYALRLCWEWLAKTNLLCLWTALSCTLESVVRAMFEAST